MSLLTRLIDPQEGEQKIPIHQFMAAIAEVSRGAPGATVDALQAAFALSTQERNALVSWYQNQVQTGNVSRELVHDVLLLAEHDRLDGSGDRIYSIQQVQNRLGL